MGKGSMKNGMFITSVLFFLTCAARPFTLVIDPGHGGKKKGCSSFSGKFFEKDLALDMAQRIKKQLVAQGFNVILTREDDCELDSELIADLQARSAVAKQVQADLFISLHFNSVLNPVAQKATRGCELYVPYDSLFLEPSYRYAGFIHHRLAHGMEQQWHGMLGNLNTWDRGIRAAKLTIFKDITCPALLIEIDYITHKQVEKNYESLAYRNKIAGIIAQGIKDAAQ